MITDSSDSVKETVRCNGEMQSKTALRNANTLNIGGRRLLMGRSESCRGVACGVPHASAQPQRTSSITFTNIYILIFGHSIEMPSDQQDGKTSFGNRLFGKTADVQIDQKYGLKTFFEPENAIIEWVHSAAHVFSVI